MDPPRVLGCIAVFLGALLVAQALRVALRDAFRRRRFARSRERGALGEVRAGALLERLGFTILGRQVGGGYGLGVDGARVEVGVRADYVVAARGQRYVAEVKTGAFAPRLDTAATRRQLLEYSIAFEVDGVLLVDADREEVRLVEFPLPAPAAAKAGRLVWLGAGMVAGALATLAFLDRAR